MIFSRGEEVGEREREEARKGRKVLQEVEGRGGRLSEEDRAKGIILIAPDFLSSPLCDPRVRFLIHPRPPSSPRRPPPYRQL